MGYFVLLENNAQRLWWQEWKDGVRKKERVSKTEAEKLGFLPNWNIEESREYAKSLNAADHLERKKRRALARTKEAAVLKSAYLPPPITAEFEKKFLTKKKDAYTWRLARKAICELDIPFADWWVMRKQWVEWFKSRRLSPDYSNRIIETLNEYGEFFSWRKKKFFKRIDRLDRLERQSLEKVQRKHHKSQRLNYALLREFSSGLRSDVHNWLYISIAFGLRPQEMRESLPDPERRYITRTHLYVRQPKVETKDTEPKWKRIPIKTVGQRRAIEMIRSNSYFIGTYAALRKHLITSLPKGFTQYAAEFPPS